jgi:hypothetical protein
MKNFSCFVALCATSLVMQAEATDIITDSSDIYINAKTGASYYLWCTNANAIGHTSAKEWSYVWTLKSAGDDAYYIYNKLHKKYLGKTGNGSNTISFVTDTDNAGKYSITHVEENLYQFKDTEDQEDNNYLVFSNGSVSYGSSSADAANIRVKSADTDATTLKNSILSYCEKRIGNYIGGVADSDKLREQIEKVKESSDFQKASKLAELVGESINMPIAGHYYQIQSAYPFYKDKIIAETYYTQDYYSEYGTQRLYFLDMEEETETIMVPTFWQFEQCGTNKYYIKGANSSMYWSHTLNNRLISTIEKNSKVLDAGIFSIFNQYYDKVVYDNAVVFYSTNKYGTDNSGCVSIFEDTHEDVHDFDVRHSDNKVAATDDEIAIKEKIQPNNWYITEVTKFDLYFPKNEKIANLDSNGDIILEENGETKSFRTVYFPFAVTLPYGVSAYTLVDKKSAIEGSFEIGEIDNYGVGTLPAKTAAILVADPGTTYTFTIDYNNTNSPVTFDLIGTLEPHPITEGEKIYVIDEDEKGHTTHTLLKVGGSDYSYDKDNLYKSTGKAWYSQYNSDATYIVENNRAYIKPTTTNPAKMKPMQLGNRTSTGVEDITVGSAPDEIRYYDMYGRMVKNPERGLFIRSDGKKVIFK